MVEYVTMRRPRYEDERVRERWFEIANILVLGTVVALGRERKGKSFLREEVGTRENIASA